jgi:hypothetical protein
MFGSAAILFRNRIQQFLVNLQNSVNPIPFHGKSRMSNG